MQKHQTNLNWGYSTKWLTNILQSVKVIKDKERLRNRHWLEEMYHWIHCGIMDSIPEQEKNNEKNW